MRVSVLNDCLNNILNAERRGKRQVLIRPSSKVIIRFLTVMQKHGYIDEFEYIDDHRSGKIVVQLNGRINKCGVVSPRFNVPLDQIENWVDRLMPARSFGIIILVCHHPHYPCFLLHQIPICFFIACTSRRPRPVSWTTRRPVGSMSLARSSDTSFRLPELS
ncbi:40S ribosomal protein S22 [Puccinia graminis f. sp. tritici]|uniref:40S ribosomal protein S22 n=1 Tax=Puccinia graminis f. sp. tritici TaxID=56615 RepID=A0A5B0LRG8_PUCGR|nr:40S ribosomal protein S22 [Puccinia graminis f. sp. tritici]